MNIEEAAIHMSIFQTMGVYHTALDDADFADLATVFTENAEMEVRGKVAVGRERIIENMRKRSEHRTRDPKGIIFQRHNLTTRKIDLQSAESALCTSYFLVLTELGVDHFGRYFDTFVRDGGKWLISRRSVQTDWMHDQSRFLVHPSAV